MNLGYMFENVLNWLGFMFDSCWIDFVKLVTELVFRILIPGYVHQIFDKIMFDSCFDFDYWLLVNLVDWQVTRAR
jgi:hypothetical protein